MNVGTMVSKETMYVVMIVGFVVVVVLIGMLPTIIAYVRNPRLSSLPDFCEWCREEEGVICCSQASCMHCCRAYEEHFNLTDLPCSEWCPSESPPPLWPDFVVNVAMGALASVVFVLFLSKLKEVVGDEGV